MSQILQLLETTLSTDGTPGTDLTALTTGSASESLSSNPVSTSAGSTSSGTISLSPLTSTTPSTLISTSSPPTSIRVTSIPSSTQIPTSSTLPPPSTSTSTSVSLTETSSSPPTIVTVTSDSTSTSTSTSELAPTTFTNSNSNDPVSRRTAVIAGTTVGLVAFILIILAAIFIYRRHKLRKAMEVSGKKREGRGLLDGEEFDDDERNNPVMQSYHDRGHPPYLSQPANSSVVSLLKSRTSESGSIFREEVWPPPGFVDPISNQSKQVDLSSIVDDVMGPSASFKPNRDSSQSNITTSSRGSSTEPDERRQPTDASAVSTLSSTSTTPLITEKRYSDPFQPNSGPPIATPLLLPVSAPAPATPGVLSKTPYPIVAPIPSPPPIARSQPRFPNTQPQKSSPLARTVITETNLWLTRNVRPNRTKPGTPP